MLAVNRYDNIVNTLESLTQSGLCDDLSVVSASGRTPYQRKSLPCCSIFIYFFPLKIFIFRLKAYDYNFNEKHFNYKPE